MKYSIAVFVALSCQHASAQWPSNVVIQHHFPGQPVPPMNYQIQAPNPVNSFTEGYAAGQALRAQRLQIEQMEVMQRQQRLQLEQMEAMQRQQRLLDAQAEEIQRLRTQKQALE